MEAMKLQSGAMMNGEAVLGRVLRSHTTAKATKLMDSKITFKAKKTTTELAGNKREATTVTESAAAVVKRTKSNKKKVEVSTIGVSTDVKFFEEAWSISLSTEGALAEATKHLVAADAKLKQIIEAHGAAPVWEHKGSAFSALARAIVYQQLAGRAADTIYGRLIALCGGAEGMNPTVISALSAEELRTVGISARKAIYLHDLAEKFTSGVLVEEKLSVMSEDDLVTALTAVKGIGVWSAQMFMIFFLHKPDVLPVGDLGIRKGFQKLFQLKQQPSAEQMQELALSWRPYRTLASWYLWRMSDIKVPDSS